MTATALPKVGKFGEMLLGYAANFAAGQWAFDFARHNHGARVKDIMDAMPRNVARGPDGFALLAVEGGRIYEVSEDGGMVRMRAQGGYAYGAIGTGASVATGALYGWHDGRDALLHAMRAAAAHVPGVRGPFKIVSL